MNSVDIPKDATERRAWIKFQLARRGITLGQISRELKLYRTVAQKALWLQYPRLERAIAKRIGLEPKEIWPERYDAKGKPLRKQMGRPAKVGAHASRDTTRNRRNKVDSRTGA